MYICLGWGGGGGEGEGICLIGNKYRLSDFAVVKKY